ncbi:hypothetical protein OY671_011249, partial [Metschnikowia pulcherrima]
QHPGTGRLRQKEQGQGLAGQRRHRRRQPPVRHHAGRGAGRAVADDPLQGHRAGHERPVGQAGRPAVRPDHQHHAADRQRQGQGLRRHQPAARAHAAQAADHGRVRLQGLRSRYSARYVGAEGHAQAGGRQAGQEPAGRPGGSEVPGTHEAAGRHGADRRRQSAGP